VHFSKLNDWNLTHPELRPPEQIKDADAAIFIAGSEGTYIAANWARIAGVPVLGVVKFGGAGAKLYENELELFEKKYCGSISREDFEMLNQDTIEIDQLAKDVIYLAERIVMPRTVFPIRPFTKEYKDVFHSWQDVCKDFNFEVLDTEEPNSSEPILPRILDGIRRSAFVIADVTEVKPNVFYEIGYASGLGKQVVLTARTHTELPFDLKDLPVLFWDTQTDLKEQLKKRLTNVVQKLRRSGSARS